MDLFLEPKFLDDQNTNTDEGSQVDLNLVNVTAHDMSCEARMSKTHGRQDSAGFFAADSDE